jgi:hypothetical protein
MNVNVFVLYISCSQDSLCEYFQQTAELLRNNEIRHRQIYRSWWTRRVESGSLQKCERPTSWMWEKQWVSIFKTWEVNFTIILCHMLSIVTKYQLQVYTYFWIILFIHIYLVVSRPSQANFWEKFAPSPSEGHSVTIIYPRQVLNPSTQNFRTISKF